MTPTNRRIFPRHVLGNSSLIMCEAGSGEVIDISRSGLAFTPLTFKAWPKNKFKIDLILNTPETSILDIDCTMVYPDTKVNNTPDRCGITFDNLTPDQEDVLETFCAHYTFIPLSR